MASFSTMRGSTTLRTALSIGWSSARLPSVRFLFLTFSADQRTDRQPLSPVTDGTCTGEHGVGVGKKEYLISELGEGTVGLMKTVKNAIDPLGIMNPGKVRRAVGPP